ncbi:MAG: signal peptidase I, partial [Candidatus Marinimicrobia bacterium]|nr:signal peptidase I [Candidatus Neomarinimicrobiota bacterium]
TQGNRDNFKPLRIPRKGDVIAFNGATNWQYLIPIMLMDGHTVTLENDAVKYEFTMFEPLDVIRRKKRTSQQKIMSQYYPNGQLLTPWSNQLSYNSNQVRFLHIDGKSISNWAEYVVEQDYYWMMGDNRDDSADSRYWGFVPRSYILGEALFSYMSINFKTWLPRLNRIGVIIR